MKGMSTVQMGSILILLFCSHALFGQGTEEESESKPKSRRNSIFRLSDRDVILPITSIEWGVPDRWSFTSRFVHSFKKQEKRTWHHNFDIYLSPGISGGRLGAGYLGIFDPPSMRDFGLFYQLHGVLLRTWGNPLSAPTNTTFVGAELKICISWLLNVGAGYYSPLTKSNRNLKSFWGFHFGIGI